MELAAALTARGAGDRRPWAVGRLLRIDSAANLAGVSIDGSPEVLLPYAPGVYTDVTTVLVLRDPYGSGAGQMVLCPYYAEAAPPPPPPSQDDPEVVGTVTETALVRPTWSGTWRQVRSAWDRWNVDRYGGRSTLYQGDAYGSGPLTGLATYGDQLVSLGAVEFTRVVVSTPVATGSGTVVVQGAPHASKPSGAPQPSGETASGTTKVDLSATVREGLRTGVVKSLATVGSAYRGTYGTSRADGMALSVTYTRRA